MIILVLELTLKDEIISDKYRYGTIRKKVPSETDGYPSPFPPQKRLSIRRHIVIETTILT